MRTGAGAPGTAAGRAGGRPASPCVDICRLDPVTGWCEGCLRTIEEIAGWAGFDEAARERVWERLPLRAAQRATTGDAPARDP